MTTTNSVRTILMASVLVLVGGCSDRKADQKAERVEDIKQAREEYAFEKAEYDKLDKERVLLIKCLGMYRETSLILEERVRYCPPQERSEVLGKMKKLLKDVEDRKKELEELRPHVNEQQARMDRALARVRELQPK